MLKSVCSFLSTKQIANKFLDASGLIKKACGLKLLREFHVTSAQLKFDKRALIAALPKKDEGAEGEKIVDIDNVASHKSCFPDVNTPNKLFDGIPFKDIPIINIKCSRNNTLLALTDPAGKPLTTISCGTEGFKHARKATNIAAQATGLSLSAKVLNAGYKTFRIKIRGLGPGRMSALRGLHMGGLNIVSVTDYTRVSWNPPRARKAKRL